MPFRDSDEPTILEALSALAAEDLRALILAMIPWLDERNLARLQNDLLDKAARKGGGWIPPGPSPEQLQEAEDSATEAIKAGYAEADEADLFLRLGSNAFLGRDYPATFRIFRAWLGPIAEFEIDLGQHEMLDEVLTMDTMACASQYVVATYMTSAPARRAQAVLKAVHEVKAAGLFWTPLQQMERISVEPLPGFQAFLSDWRAIVEERIPKERPSTFDAPEDQWLREVVGRLEGSAGLARICTGPGCPTRVGRSRPRCLSGAGYALESASACARRESGCGRGTARLGSGPGMVG